METAIVKSANGFAPFNRLKDKWGIKSNWQVIAILLTFTCTGSTVVMLKSVLFQLLGFNNNTAVYLKVIVYLIFVFPAYQSLILLYGALFGQFKFFLEKEKKLLRRLKIIPQETK
jgi:hypothetical protein